MSRAVLTNLPTVRVAALGQMGALGLCLMALSSCSAGPMGGAGGSVVGPSGAAAQGQANLETQQACRQRANEIFDQRNRGDIYAANPSVNTPYSANYQPGITSRGLPGQFAYEQTQADCERNGARVDTAAPAPPVAKGR
jgi:hypothetical protein